MNSLNSSGAANAPDANCFALMYVTSIRGDATKPNASASSNEMRDNRDAESAVPSSSIFRRIDDDCHVLALLIEPVGVVFLNEDVNEEEPE